MEHALKRIPKRIYTVLDQTLDRVLVKKLQSNLSIEDAAILLSARDSPSVSAIAAAADACRAAAPCKDNVSYVVNRNINFTNACVMRCGFCAFSRTGIDEEAYFLPLEEIVRRAVEAAGLGATEICIQAGLPPNMDKDLYVTVAKSVKAALPDIHLHAFSPEEVIYGAKRNKISVLEMMTRLKEAGVNSFPGTSAEILDDSVRDRIAKGRLSSAQWRESVQAAHSLYLPTTATMMYGHLETVIHVADHISQIREIQTSSKNEYGVGFTEFVPLSFVAKESPLWKAQNERTNKNGIKQNSHLEDSETGPPSALLRSGPTGIEVILTHAVSRLMLAGHVDNIQVSWPKEGYRMSQHLLGCGVNDLGGTLMNESISTAAGAAHGQFASPSLLRSLITNANRTPIQRNTDYSLRRTFEEPQGTFPGSISREHSALDDISDSVRTFGSFEKLTKSSENRYIDFHKKSRDGGRLLADKNSGKRFYSSSSSSFSYLPLSTSSRSKSPFISCSTSSSLCTSTMPPAHPSPHKPIPQHLNDSSESMDKKISYSSSFTIVPTYECFNLCTYCNFRTNVHSDDSKMISLDEVTQTLLRIQKMNEEHPLNAVHEILILSGEVHPRSHRREGWLKRILDICDLCLQFGFLPHTNVGPLSIEEMRCLGAVNASMGLMMEQTVPLAVHRLAPSKVPALRMEQLAQAGELRIPFTTGVLLGIGESFTDRVQTLYDISELALKYGHVQEVIIQPYSTGVKDQYGAGGAAGFDLSDLPLFVARARSILPRNVLIQVPPNLVCKGWNKHTEGEGDREGGMGGGRNDFLLSLLDAGAADLGGISPLDEVNPTYEFQKVELLREQLKFGDYQLVQRLPVYEKHFSSLSEKVKKLVDQKYTDFYTKFG